MKTLPKGYTAREQNSWCLYDVANSVFATSAIAVFLPGYIGSLATAGADSAGFVHVLGIPLYADSFWSYLVGFSVFLQVLVLPLVGAFADFTRRKRQVLGATAFLGACCALAMFFPRGSSYLIAAGLFVVANVALGASTVVYNSFLPEVAPPENRDGLSSKGWALGYVAGCVMLVAHLGLFARASSWHISQELAQRIALASTGAWWMVWTIPVYLGLHNRGTPHTLPPGKSIAGVAFGQLAETVKHMRSYPETLKFLVAYLLYNDAIQTVFIEAAEFGERQLKLDKIQLVVTILISQLVGIVGALAFSKLARRTTAKVAVVLTLIVWMLLLLYAYAFVNSAMQFYVMGAVAGLVMGGSQALSRSIFAQLVPHGKEAEYFSVYEIGDKGTSWMGPPAFGLALQFTGSYRVAMLSLLVFFGAGLGVLTQADVHKGEQDVFQGDERHGSEAG